MSKDGSKMLQKHIKNLKVAKGRSVEAGWFDSARYPDAKGRPGVQVAYIARVQEFGATIALEHTTITIPARPFMRLAWSNFNKGRAKIQVRIASDIVSGKINVEQGLGQVGLELEGYIVKSIRSGGWQANSPATIRGKGFNKPLINTAHMWQSVSSKVY